MKRTVTITIDEELHNKAREEEINISKACEKGIKDRLNIKEVQINPSNGICSFCGRKDRIATRDDLKGLTWLWPDERWICESCLQSQSRHLK